VNLPPWLVLGLLIALILALIYQITTRRFGWRVVAYWMLILGGFLLAETLAESIGWNVTRVGDLRMLPDLAGAAVIVGILWALRL